MDPPSVQRSAAVLTGLITSRLSLYVLELKREVVISLFEELLFGFYKCVRYKSSKSKHTFSSKYAEFYFRETQSKMFP